VGKGPGAATLEGLGAKRRWFPATYT